MSADISNNLQINIEEVMDKEKADIFKKAEQLVKEGNTAEKNEILKLVEQLAKGGNTAETSASLIKERWELGEFLGLEYSDNEGSQKTQLEDSDNEGSQKTQMAPIHMIMDPKIDNLKNEYRRTSYYSDSDSGDECNNIKREFEQLVNENEIADIYRINNSKHNLVKINGNETEDDSNTNDSNNSENKKLVNTKPLIDKINPNITKTELLGKLSNLEIDWHDMDTIKKSLNETFSSNLVSLSSTHLDIICSYLNSQKSIYTEASYYTSTLLNYLMIPTIIISAGASVISGAEESIPHAPLIISCITAFSAFLLSVINYLKLDAASEAHKISAHQYDKLQSHIMFFSGKTLLFSQSAFNCYTRPERESKRMLEKKQKVRNMIKEQQEKNLTDLENLKENYKKDKKELEWEINVKSDELLKVQMDLDILFANQNTLDKNEFKIKKTDIDVLQTKIHNERERASGQLSQIYDQFKENKLDKKNKLKTFMKDFERFRSEAIDAGTIELNNEDTEQQQNLMAKILEEMDDVQKKIKEIKETNQFEVPRTIRNRYPNAYNINVFSLIKMIEDYKIILTIKLWICRNNLRQYRTWINYCSELISNGNLSENSREMIENQIEKFNKVKIKCAEKKNIIYESIVALSVAYIEIDAILEDELKVGEIKKTFGYFYYLCPCFIKLLHDSSWVENSFINHIYESAGKNVKKLQAIDKTSKNRNWIGNNLDEEDIIGDLMV